MSTSAPSRTATPALALRENVTPLAVTRAQNTAAANVSLVELAAKHVRVARVLSVHPGPSLTVLEAARRAVILVPRAPIVPLPPVPTALPVAT